MKKSIIYSAAANCISSACVAITAEASTITIPADEITSLSEAPSAAEFTEFFKGVKAIGIAVSGICIITALMFFAINLTRLSTSAGNDMQRSRALKGILLSSVSLTLFGGITIVVSIFWNLI